MKRQFVLKNLFNLTLPQKYNKLIQISFLSIFSFMVFDIS